MGFEVRRAGWDGWGPEKLRRLSRCETVIDVGVCNGTPSLYAAFPDAFLLLVDPLDESEVPMARHLVGRRGAVEQVAVSDSAGSLPFNVAADRSASSLHERSNPAAFRVEIQQTVIVRTLDDVVLDHDPPAPYLLKIDTEGHELSVLRGASRTLADVDCVIAEVSVANRFEGSYRFDEVITLLAARGLYFTDLLTVRRDANSKQPTRMDLAFTHEA